MTVGQEFSRRRTITPINTSDPTRAISRAIVMAQTSNAADSALRQRRLELVFVYGSLKRGMANHRQLAGATFAGTAVLRGLALFDLGPFPMAVASSEPGNRLWGELYRVNGPHLAALDRFEGVPRLYQRLRWHLGDGQPVWVYVGRPHQVRFVNQISSGSWGDVRSGSEGQQPASAGGQGQGQG
jgi:gamma-glutamylcyclotransferase (GGCT)/AIG2-like uncharacterized protein YtfP